MFLLAAVVGGCGRSPEEGGPLTGEGPMEEQVPRIVTLAPALTQMVVDLGLEQWLVGVSRHDEAAPPGVPVVGDILDLNMEALLSVRPTHVLAMQTREGLPGPLKELAEQGRFALASWPSPQSIEEVGQILLDERELLGEGERVERASLGAILGVRERAMEVKLRMMSRLAQLSRLTASRSSARPRVLLVLGTDPLGAVGPGTVHHQLLTTVNAINALEEAGSGYVVLEREKLLAINPDVILLLLPGAPGLGSLEKDARLAVFRGLEITAVQKRQIRLVAEPGILLPSSNLDRIAAALAAGIWPELKPEIDQILQVSPWAEKAGAEAPPSQTPGRQEGW